jgi:hypothetical protein
MGSNGARPSLPEGGERSGEGAILSGEAAEDVPLYLTSKRSIPSTSDATSRPEACLSLSVASKRS